LEALGRLLAMVTLEKMVVRETVGKRVDLWMKTQGCMHCKKSIQKPLRLKDFWLQLLTLPLFQAPLGQSSTLDAREGFLNFRLWTRSVRSRTLRKRQSFRTRHEARFEPG